MSRIFSRASSEYLDASVSPPETYFTMAAWVYAQNLDTDLQTVMSFGQSTGNMFHRLFFDNVGLTIQGYDGINGRASTSPNGMIPNTWNHCLGTTADLSNPQVWLNGRTAGPYGSTPTTLSGLNRCTIGALNNVGGVVHHCDSIIAQPAVWLGVLSPSEIFALLAGAPPWQIQSNNLWLDPRGFDEVSAGGIVLQSSKRAFIPFSDNNTVGVSSLAPPIFAMRPKRGIRVSINRPVKMAGEWRGYAGIGGGFAG